MYLTFGVRENEENVNLRLASRLCLMYPPLCSLSACGARSCRTDAGRVTFLPPLPSVPGHLENELVPASQLASTLDCSIYISICASPGVAQGWQMSKPGATDCSVLFD